MTDLDGLPAGLDPNTPNVARIYDYWLDGKDNFQVDRDFAEKIIAIEPAAPYMARQNRGFLGRAVRFLTAEAGIRQFIDIGTGLPTQRSVHQVAQEIAPDARIVYVDSDEVVRIHARALLGDSTNVAAVRADFRDPETILAHPDVAKLIDFDQPFALLLLAILHFIPDDDDPLGIIGRYREVMAPGSHLAISCSTREADPERADKIIEEYRKASAPAVLRTGAEILRFFDGFELLDPGRLVYTPQWRPADPVEADPKKAWMLAGLGRRI
ncbi:MAG TPA: SAM-dependent methyltransferase [Streptosporangiaceae bacterium]|nr:SAM-dependent methyltransferase [Streptosporangiaceae bacterium]